MKLKSLKLLYSKDGKSFLDPVSKKYINTTKFLPINTRFLVSIHGHVFDSFNEYEKLPTYFVEGHRFVDIKFDDKKDGVPFLLGEIILMTFNEKYKVGDKFTYKTKSKHCCLKNLIHLSQGSIRTYPESELENWQCYNKASYANTRVLGLSATNFSITATDVYESLLRTNFRCSYCGEPLLKFSKWHLDHIVPISKKGNNDRTNITPACVDCNIMKHNLTVDQFFAKIQRIAHSQNMKKTGRFEILDFTDDAVFKYSRAYIVPSEIL